MDLRSRIRQPAALTALLCSLLVLGCDPGGAGRRAYRQGRFDDAREAFAAAETAEGEGASAELLANRALAAVRAGAFREADAAAERAADRGDPETAAFAVFLRGNAAFGLAELAERQADTPEAEPFAYDVAIRYAESARDLWRQAATSRADWPEARRNVERALLLIAELERKKVEKERKPERRPEPEPNPLPESGGEGRTTEQEAEAKAHLTELEPERVLELLEKLAEKEREKLTLRRAHRRERMADVERDW